MPKSRRVAFWLSLGTALVLSLPAASAEESRPELLFAAFPLPRDMFGDLSVADPSHPPKLKPLSGKEASRFGAPAYNARAFLSQLGVPEAPGSEAVYLWDTQVLMVRNTKENLEFIRPLLEKCDHSAPSVSVEIRLVSLDLPAEMITENSLSYSRLKNIAGKSWKEVAQIKTLGKSGTQSRSLISGDGHALPMADSKEHAKAPPLPTKGEAAAAYLEPVLGPNCELDCDVDVAYRSSANPPELVRYTGNVSVTPGLPKIVQITKAGSSGKTYALILQAGMPMDTNPREDAAPTPGSP